MEINSEGYHMQEEKEKEECIICLDEVEKEWRELECHHRYHKQCIENWIKVKARCPLCMKQIHNRREERNRIEQNINDVAVEEIHMIGIKRFLICMCCVIILLVIMVISSS
jgi:hypothetical protein